MGDTRQIFGEEFFLEEVFGGRERRRGKERERNCFGLIMREFWKKATEGEGIWLFWTKGRKGGRIRKNNFRCRGRVFLKGFWEERRRKPSGF
ncbi:hypothetical protein, partial [Thermopolyspora flexuosa]|uniref:hypothetical protein n=1 Tax=Thermopolyspora flexuosa TaxID=103836 RepID=UPI001E59CCA1